MAKKDPDAVLFEHGELTKKPIRPMRSKLDSDAACELVIKAIRAEDDSAIPRKAVQ